MRRLYSHPTVRCPIPAHGAHVPRAVCRLSRPAPCRLIRWLCPARVTGAGLSNILFATEGTPVIEVCYDSNGGRVKEMNCPAMYAAMAVNLNLPYWVVTGSGTYISGMQADLTQLRAAVDEALGFIARPETASPPPVCGAMR